MKSLVSGIVVSLAASLAFAEENFDIVIYGSSPAAISAAV